MNSAAPAAHALILAGGRGTRFWPRSRTRSPKQLLNIVGQKTMLEQTYERLVPLFPRSKIWVVTNKEQVDQMRRQLRQVPARHALVEPFGRNTAAAIGLASVHLLKASGSDALMAVLPADHFIGKPARYRRIVRVASVAVDLYKIREQRRKDIQRVRPVDRPRSLDAFECSD